MVRIPSQRGVVALLALCVFPHLSGLSVCAVFVPVRKSFPPRYAQLEQQEYCYSHAAARGVADDIPRLFRVGCFVVAWVLDGAWNVLLPHCVHCLTQEMGVFAGIVSLPVICVASLLPTGDPFPLAVAVLSLIVMNDDG
jgi:hypothetical protein